MSDQGTTSGFQHDEQPEQQPQTEQPATPTPAPVEEQPITIDEGDDQSE